MPGATVARLVSCAWEMAAKLDMMPQTVPNKPTNGATDEMMARLGSPPSERVKQFARGARHRVRDARPQLADRLARNAAAHFLVAGDNDAG